LSKKYLEITLNTPRWISRSFCEHFYNFISFLKLFFTKTPFPWLLHAFDVCSLTINNEKDMSVWPGFKTKLISVCEEA
jgi:hypothetical protein